MAIKFHSDIESSGDLALYNPVNDGNPVLSLGKDANDRAEITAEFHSGSQTFNRLRFRTFSSSTSSNAGRILFQVDEVSIGEFKDTGFNINSAKSLMVEGNNIITGDGSGGCTLSNIDAIDATTEATIEAAIDTLGNLTIASSLARVGTINTGVWEGTAIAADQQKHLMHYQVQGYSAGSTNYVVSKNIASNTAPFKHDVDIGSDGTTAKSVTVWMRMGGHVMPNACTLKRFTGWTESAGSASQTLALFRVRLADDSDTDPSAVLLQEVTYTASGNQIANLFNVTDASGEQSLDLAAGDIIFPAIKGAGNPTYFNGTFEVEF